MAYELKSEIQINGFDGEVGLRAPRTAYEGWRAFVRTPAGKYREVLSVERASDTDWVQGEYQGAWGAYTFETRDAALTNARKAFRYLNRARAA